MSNRKYKTDEGQATSAKGPGSFCFVTAVNEAGPAIKSYVLLLQSAGLLFPKTTFVSEAVLMFKPAFIYIQIYLLHQGFLHSYLASSWLLLTCETHNEHISLYGSDTFNKLYHKNSWLYFTAASQCSNVNHMLKEISNSPLLQRLTDNSYHLGKHKPKQKLDSHYEFTS